MIHTSLEWNDIEITLKRKARNLTNGADVYKMINNIKYEIKDLSIAEIEARRGRPRKAQELLAKVNEDIEMVEEYLLIAALMG